MNFELSNVLKSIGPAASIIFAAWIFMGFLQQRYDTAVARYQEMIEAFRSGELSRERRSNIKDQILVYKRRCELMGRANLVGLVAAILLILTLVAGELDIVFPGLAPLKYVSAGCALLGFCLVIVATGFVIAEGMITRRQLDSELLDQEDLAHSIGQEAGAIGDRGRRDATARR